MIKHCVTFERPLKNAVLATDGSQCSSANSKKNNRRPLIASASQSNDATNAHDSIAPVLDPSLLIEISEQISEFNQQADGQIQDMKKLAIQLAIIVVEEIIGSSNGIRLERLERLLDEACHRNESIVAVYVSPTDHDGLSTRISENPEVNIAIRSDDTVQDGECRVEYVAHELVSSLEHQLSEMRHRLVEAIQNDCD